MASIINATTTAGVSVQGDNSGSLQLATNNGTTAVTIDTSQNVGIGVTPSSWDTYANNIQTPTGSIVSYSPSSNFGAVQNAYYSSGWKYSTSNFASFYLQSSGVHSWSYASSGTAGNSVTFNEAMRLDSSGQATLTSTSGTGLSVVNNYTGNGTPLILTQAATNIYNACEIRNSSATAVFIVAANGNVTNTNNSYGGISDAKLKENIVDATPKLDKLMQVKVRNYNLKGDDLEQIGVVAQELEQVFPSLIEETTDKDADDNNLGTTTKSVKYSVFVPMLIKAIQELKATVDAQATTIAELQARLPAENT